MDASGHYDATVGLLGMVVERKDEEKFDAIAASLLIQTAQVQALAGILRHLLDAGEE